MITPVKNLPTPKEASKLASGVDKVASEEGAAEGDFASLLMGELDAEAVEAEAMLPVDMPAAELSASANIQAAPVKADALQQVLQSAPEGTLPVADPTMPTPKVMDPALIQQVQEAVMPGGEQVQAPLKEMLMREPGRAPGLDFAQAEVDPQLMDMGDFVAQKNAFSRKAMVPNAYGMPTRQAGLHATGAQGKAAGPQALGAEAPSAGTGSALSSGEFGMGLDPAALLAADAGNQTRFQEAPTASAKVFDVSTLKGTNLDADSVMSQITDYVVQARAAKEPTVQLKMRHEDLGVLDITVNRAAGNMVNIAINTQDHGVKAFLGQHRDQLLGHLSQAGVGVGELKMDVQTPSRDSLSGQQQQHADHGQGRGFGSESNQRRHDQQRREDLWDVLREKAAA